MKPTIAPAYQTTLLLHRPVSKRSREGIRTKGLHSQGFLVVVGDPLPGTKVDFIRVHHVKEAVVPHRSTSHHHW